MPQETLVVVGNGMVGHRFCERLAERDLDRRYRVVTFADEPRPAYDRVGLSKFFEHRSAEKLALGTTDWYAERGIELHLGDRVESIDRERKLVVSRRGRQIAYDRLVLATGSSAWVPPVDGVDKDGVFVYRTIEDLERIIAWSEGRKRAAVIGGGLLGLEAAKATLDLGLETHVVELAPRLMPRQIDDSGSRVLVEKIESLGVRVLLGRATERFVGNGHVDGILFRDGEQLDVDMIVVSAGIRPRDQLARGSGIDVGERGGIVVDDRLQTSDPSIFAIGEVALHRGMIYGLVAPGYEMADALVARLLGDETVLFEGAELSTKLKLLGVDVASFGLTDASDGTSRAMSFEDPFAGVYKKLVFSSDGRRLLGGVLVGDASDYGTLVSLSRSTGDLPVTPADLLVGARADGGALGADSLDNSAQVCSCHNVSKGAICSAICEGSLGTVGDVRVATRAGSGCGGCLPLVKDVLEAELRRRGVTVRNTLCEHFDVSRTELYQIVKIKGLRTFDEILSACGQGNGCETCRPAVASILASLWNDPIIEHAGLQDTNDRFLANMQRGGLYSVVPRVPGGEITPEKLIVLGEVARKYGLYTKITGGQRIDLFGAQLHELPEIWEELIAAGFESGHAYGKALRTVKSCVGTTWCRYGVQDSVGFAIRIEERYRGIRAPHKLKGGVSGCTRECAEAQSKDFGLIATETGYNLYVCGNGGAKPRHADLLASDLDEETAIRYLDRFLIYYIETADRLTRTSVWLEKLEGGLERLREIVVEDALGIAEDLERHMQRLVDTYRCEWRDVVESPEKRKLFRQFVNSDEHEAGIEIVQERGQLRPKDWPREVVVPIEDVRVLSRKGVVDVSEEADERRSVRVGSVEDFPRDAGATVRYGRSQIAVYRFASRGEWYATQEMCPHRQSFVLSRGLLGDIDGTPKVACPLHKKNFSLETGECLTGEKYAVEVFPVKVEESDVLLFLPPEEVVDRALAGASVCDAHGTCDHAEREAASVGDGLAASGHRERVPVAGGAR